MSSKVTKMDVWSVWSGEIQDQPGAVAGVLRRLAEANTDLEMVVARRQPDRPGAGIVFLAPVKGRRATAAAAVAGLSPAPGVAALRVEGTNRPGLGAKMTSTIADAGINMRGLSAAVLGSRFVAYGLRQRRRCGQGGESDQGRGHGKGSENEVNQALG